jgi:hypothetical protein
MAITVMLSLISPVSTMRSACANGTGRTSMNSVSSGGLGAGVSPSAQKRDAVSSTTLFEVWYAGSGIRRAAVYPISSRSSRWAASSRASPEWTPPVGISQ